MFAIGDSIIYPMHGAGTIESIEERQILGEVRPYYIIRIKKGGMQAMVPVDSSEEIGLRFAMTLDILNDVYDTLAAESTIMDSNWNRRNRENMDKLKTGIPKEVASVIRNLVRADRIKKLSTGEKKLLSNAKNVLASEIQLILNLSEEEALEIIDSHIT